MEGDQIVLSFELDYEIVSYYKFPRIACSVYKCKIILQKFHSNNNNNNNKTQKKD